MRRVSRKSVLQIVDKKDNYTHCYAKPHSFSLSYLLLVTYYQIISKWKHKSLEEY